MRKNAQKVIDAFKRYESAQGDSKRTIWTDGKAVYSYAMKIAEHTDNNESVWIAHYSSAPSNTTRSHIRAVQRSFNVVKSI